MPAARRISAVEIDGRQYLGEGTRRREVVRRKLDNGDEWLSYAGIALAFQISLGVVEHRQAGKGWRGNSWMPLRSTPFTVSDSQGRRRELPFIRKSALQQCLDRDEAVRARFSRAGDETLERFKWDGRWVLTFSSLRRFFRCGLGKPLRERVRPADLVAETIRHPLTGKPVEVFPEAKVLAATDARDAASDAGPPDLNGRKAIWYREFLDKLRDARGQKASLRWDTPLHWVEAPSRHLDGHRMRSGQMEGGRKERYVDKGDAELITASVRAEARGGVSSGRRALTTGEAERLLGLTGMQIRWAAQTKAVKKVGKIGRTGLYDRSHLESLRRAKIAGPRRPPEGWASGEQLRKAPEIVRLPFMRQRFVPSRLQEFRAQYTSPRAWRKFKFGHVQGFIYRVQLVLPFLTSCASANPRGQSKRGPKGKAERNATWLRWYEDKNDKPVFRSPAGIRDRWNRENPRAQIATGRAGEDLVNKGLAAARAARAAEALAPS